MIGICSGGCGRRSERRGRRRSGRERRNDDGRRSERKRSGSVRRRRGGVGSERRVGNGIARSERSANFAKSAERRNARRRTSRFCAKTWPRSTKKSLVAVWIRARASGEWRCRRPRPRRRLAGDSSRCRRRRFDEPWRCRRRRPRRRTDARSNGRTESVDRESATTAGPEVEAAVARGATTLAAADAVEARVQALAVAVLAVVTRAVDHRRDAVAIDRAVEAEAEAAAARDVVDTRRVSPIRARGRDRQSDVATDAAATSDL